MNDDVMTTQAPQESAAPEAIETVEASERPFLTTDFEEYTVSEGLLLVLLLSVFAAAVVAVLKRGFSWLK